MANNRDNTILIFAFRYALGRTSAAPSMVADELKKHWCGFKEWEQKQIHDDITIALNTGSAGHDCDEVVWSEILALPVSTKNDQ